MKNWTWQKTFNVFVLVVLGVLWWCIVELAQEQATIVNKVLP
jgi:hypothetical protein